MTEKLKPCPFCGGEAEVEGERIFWVSCQKCWVETSSFNTLEEAIEAWNRRVCE